MGGPSASSLCILAGWTRAYSVTVTSTSERCARCSPSSPMGELALFSPSSPIRVGELAVVPSPLRFFRGVTCPEGLPPSASARDVSSEGFVGLSASATSACVALRTRTISALASSCSVDSAEHVGRRPSTTSDDVGIVVSVVSPICSASLHTCTTSTILPHCPSLFISCSSPPSFISCASGAGSSKNFVGFLASLISVCLAFRNKTTASLASSCGVASSEHHLGRRASSISGDFGAASFIGPPICSAPSHA
mmetsp:Transcript_4051/g.9940  ORF Transcript_4051/g.9940 Transcript_4051/m.9940 type:complete len:251 (-) Transcript_4051:838-1590(-)